MRPTPETEDLQTQVISTLLSRQQLRHASILTSGSYLERCYGAVLFVDLSGFTALTESFAQAGRAGSERLSSVIRDTFDELIAATHANGGDVIAFAGDAIWALWPVFLPNLTPDTDPLANATLAATRAALRIQAGFAKPAPDAVVTVRTRATIGTGRVTLHSISTAPSKLEFVATGPAISDAGAIGRSVHPGEVILSPSATRLVRSVVVGREFSDGTMKVTALETIASEASSLRQTVTPAIALTHARAYLPGFVLQSIDQSVVEWLAEFRHVSVVFIKLHEAERTLSDDHERLSKTVRSIHAATARYGGERYQLLMDEKGLICIVAFGLPFSATEDDAARAVRAALEIEQVLLEHGISVSIGCTSGTVFCSVTGNDQRRAYVMTGSALNLAARLMQSDAQGILCDHNIRTAVSNQAGIGFEALPPRTVPGRDDAVLVYRPSLRSRSLWPQSASEGLPRLIGRHQERLLLATTVNEYVSTGKTRIVLIEGEPGIGKSCLMGHLVELLKEQHITSLLGAGDSLDHGTNYYAVRTVIRELLASMRPPKERSEIITDLCERIHAPELFPYVPLLRDYVPLPLEENEVTSVLTEEGRANRLRDLLLSCLDTFCRTTPAAMLIEDAHWLDDASWAFLLRAVRSIEPILVVLTTRNVPQTAEFAYEQLIKLPNCRRIVLSPLLESDIGTLLSERLHVDTVPNQVLKLVSARAAGNPFFSLELLYALRDHELVTLNHTRCSARATDLATAFDASLAKIGLPSNLQGVVVSRFERLTLHQQLALKVASIIGQPFDLQLFCAVAPLRKLADVLENVVTSLVDADFLRVASTHPEVRYVVSHALLQEAIYASIPYAQRRRLHASIASWYEAQGTQANTHKLLAHHYSHGGQPGKALLALETAGAEAQKRHNSGEAARLYARALQVFDECYSADNSRKARQHRGNLELALGRAQVSCSNYADAIHHLECGLTRLGYRVPRSAVWVACFLVWELFLQVWYRLVTPSPTTTAQHREHLLEIACAYEGLIECYFNSGANLFCLYSAVASLNRAERAGPSAALARAYSSFGAIVGFVPLETIARGYCHRAQAVASQVANREAIAWVAVATGVFEAGLGNFTEASCQFAETTRLGHSIGDPRRVDDSDENQIAVAYLKGHWQQGLATAERLLTSARLRDDWMMQGSALRGLAYGYLWTGRYEEAATCIADLRGIRADELTRRSPLPHVDVPPLSALLHFRHGDLESARKEVAHGIDAVLITSPMFYGIVFDYWTLAEVLLELRAHQFGGNRALERIALKRLQGFARVFPIAQSASFLTFGFAAELEGRHRAALLAYTRALAIAKALELPYWQALAHYRIATNKGEKPHQRECHLPQAIELLSALGESHYLTLAREAIESRARA